MNITIPHRYTPRAYQLPLLKAMDSGYKRAVQVWHRRAGKEKTCLNLMAKKMLERVGSYYYVFPEFAQGRKILWDGSDKDGMRFLDHFPKQILYGKPNETEMKLRIKRPGTKEPGSMLQIIGSDRYNAVMGTNPIGMIFSEYSLQDPTCWGYFRPILAENEGWAVFNFTPRGENHAYDLWELAKSNPQHWYTNILTVSDTLAVKPEILAQERKEILRLHGNDALFQQEYYCSFSVPISGAYYANHIQKAYQDARVGNVPHEPRLTVDTWWDLGVNDRMSVWFTQSVGHELRVIDYLEGSGQGLPYYISLLKEKQYIYGKHTAPHDIEVRELTNGKSRRDTASSLGINFNVAPKLPVIDGIDSARSLFDKCWFDQTKCKQGLNALKSYRKQYDDKRKTYLNTPYHDWSSNGADAFRTLAVSLNYSHRGLPTEKEDKYARKENRLKLINKSPLETLG